MNKIVALLVAVITFAAFSVNAQAEEKMFSGEVKVGVQNAYVAGFMGVTFYEHAVMQQSLTVTHNPTGLYATVWNSYSANGREDFGDEVDYTVGISRKVGECSIDAGYSFYNLSRLSDTAGDLHALYLNVDFPAIEGVTPFIGVEKDIAVDRDILPGGFLYKVGGKFVIGGINCKLYAAGHDGACGTDPEAVSIVRADASKEIRIIDNLKLTPAIAVQAPVQAEIDKRVLYSLTGSYSF